jgi:hypothetical protein
VSHHTERSQIGVREKTSTRTQRFWFREFTNSDTPREDRCPSSEKGREVRRENLTQSQPSICGIGGSHQEPSVFGPIGKSGFPRTRDSSMLKSRYAISRWDLDRPLGEDMWR